LGYAYTDSEDALYEAVTLDQVQAVARKYLKPNALVVATVTPPAQSSSSAAATQPSERG
jgi:predicted Zn-dependent peptidase